MAISVCNLNHKKLRVGDKVKLNLGITQEYVNTPKGMVLKKNRVVAKATVAELAARWFRVVIEYKNGNKYSMCINYISEYERA